MHDPRPRWQRRLLTAWFESQRLPWPLNGLLRALSGLHRCVLLFMRQPAHQTGGGPLVVVVGNVIVGGAGKTPLVAGLTKALQERGHRVGLISRGYGRQTHTPQWFLPGLDEALDEPALAQRIGDEPTWLATQTRCPIAVDTDRRGALKMLLEHCPALDIVIADDGLQHAGLARHIDIVVFDDRAYGNGRLLPAGPLRTPLTRLRTVDAVVQTQPDAGRLRAYLAEMTLHGCSPPFFESAVRASGCRQLSSGRHLSIDEAAAQFAKQRIQAFAGMAHPDKFFRTLKALGLQIEAIALPDHFDYPVNFLNTLDASVLLTTGKDAVKLPHDDPRVWVLEIGVHVPAGLINLIEERLET